MTQNLVLIFLCHRDSLRKSGYVYGGGGREREREPPGLPVTTAVRTERANVERKWHVCRLNMSSSQKASMKAFYFIDEALEA